MPDGDGVIAVGQALGELKSPVLSGDCEELVIDHSDPRAHPGMDIAFDADKLRLGELGRFYALPVDVRLRLVHRVILFRQAVHVMQEWIAVFYDQRLADLNRHNVREILAAFLIEDSRDLRRRIVAGQVHPFIAFDRHDDVGQAPIFADDDRLLRQGILVLSVALRHGAHLDFGHFGRFAVQRDAAANAFK